jgi:hypothetical protein
VAGAQVWWHAEGDAFDVARPLYAAPAKNTGFSEARRYLFRKPGTGFELRIDDERLEDDPAAPCWSWRPGFYAGEVAAELLHSGARVEAFHLDVSPDPGKLGADAFQQMVRELLAEDPSLVVGQEPATVQTGQLGRHQDPLVEFERLRRYVPDFLRALATIRLHPRKALRSVRDSVPLSHARRVDRQTAVAASRSGAVALFAPEILEPSAFDPSMRLDVPVVEETLDAAANRALKFLVTAVLQRVRTVAAALEHRVAREVASETRTPLASRWPVRRQFLHDAEARLQHSLRQVPFPQVRRAEVSAAGLNAVSADPLYARAWGRGWRALRQGIESDTTDERMWISPSWEIYERWCFMKLGRLLERDAPQWQWKWRRGGNRWSGALAGRVAELRLQPTFRTRGKASPGRWSVSKQREPDIVLRVSAGDSHRFLVFDAKYRATRANVLDAMQSAHIYQDSLRIGAQRPEASLLLVPANEGAAWLGDAAFQAEHKVGVHVMAPGGEPHLPPAIVGLLEG